MSPIYQTDDPFYRKEEADADSRDAEIAKLREALANIRAEIERSTDAALQIAEPSVIALTLYLSISRIFSIAAKASEEGRRG